MHITSIATGKGLHPDMAYKRLLSWAEGQLPDYEPDPYGTPEQIAGELFVALNEWSSENGYPPAPWRGYGEVRYDDGYRAGQRDMIRDLNPPVPKPMVVRVGRKVIRGKEFVYTVEHAPGNDDFRYSLYKTVDDDAREFLMRANSLALCMIAANGLGKCDWSSPGK